MPTENQSNVEYMASKVMRMPDGEQVRVLVIDDDDFISGIYIMTLRKAGANVKSVPDGETGAKAAELFKPHVILLDVLMPGLDGFETIKRLKQNKATSGIPVVFLTSLSQNEDVSRGTSLGAFAFLKKTETLPEDSLNTVRRAIGLSDGSAGGPEGKGDNT
jgi:PleD family two-component response regulator